MGRVTGQARVPSSCISAKESQSVPHKPHSFRLAPLLVAFVFIVEEIKKKKKEKQKRGWDTERKTKMIKAGFGHWQGACRRWWVLAATAAALPIRGESKDRP